MFFPHGSPNARRMPEQAMKRTETGTVKSESSWRFESNQDASDSCLGREDRISLCLSQPRSRGNPMAATEPRLSREDLARRGEDTFTRQVRPALGPTDEGK